jgi:hypothetical protein
MGTGRSQNGFGSAPKGNTLQFLRTNGCDFFEIGSLLSLDFCSFRRIGAELIGTSLDDECLQLEAVRDNVVASPNTGKIGTSKNRCVVRT